MVLQDLAGGSRMTLRIAMCALASLVTSCATPSKSELDAEVRRLCAIDGGVKVYETVRLPADKFDQWGQINFYRPTRNEDAVGPDYTFKESVHYYRKGDADAGTGDSVMARRHYQVLRKVDGKLLGETVLYGRRGGDMPGPWHPSTFSCPDPSQAGEVALLNRIFVLHE